MSRVLTVTDRRELEQTVDQYVAERGYKLKSDDGTEAWLVAKGMGSFWWHLLFLFLTAGFGNVAYAAYVRWHADSVKIEVDP